jgi:Flp pilus assembly protein TadG
VSVAHARDERGDETIEAVLVTPVLLLLIMVVIQFGLWYHASHVAEAAAQQGAGVARVEAATAADGRTSAQQFMADAAGALVDHVTVLSTRDNQVVRVVVDGTVHSIVPGLNLHVHGEATSPIERFRPDTP